MKKFTYASVLARAVGMNLCIQDVGACICILTSASPITVMNNSNIIPSLLNFYIDAIKRFS